MTEFLAMVAIKGLQGGAYGGAVETELEDCLGRPFNGGQISTLLSRLEKRNLIVTSQVQGRRKMRALTPEGKRLLAKLLNSIDELRGVYPEGA